MITNLELIKKVNLEVTTSEVKITKNIAVSSKKNHQKIAHREDMKVYRRAIKKLAKVEKQ